MSKKAELTLVDQGWLLLASDEGPAPGESAKRAESETIPINATQPIPTDVLRELLKNDVPEPDELSPDDIELAPESIEEDEPIPSILQPSSLAPKR